MRDEPTRAEQLPSQHILDMAVEIDSLRMQRSHGAGKAAADEVARHALEAWKEGFTTDRSHESILFDLAVAQAQAVWDALANSSRLVAKLKERDAMTYVIQLKPGRRISARSLGRQLIAISTLLTAEAKTIGGAKLDAMIDGIMYHPDDKNEIQVRLGLFHTAGFAKEVADA